MRELSLTQPLCSSWLRAGNYHLKAAAVKGEIRKAGSYDNREEGEGGKGRRLQHSGNLYDAYSRPNCNTQHKGKLNKSSRLTN